MITDLLLRYGLGIVLVLGMVKVLFMMLNVGESPMHVARVALLYMGLPFLFWVVWLYPLMGGPLIFVVLLLDPRFFVGRAIMSALYPFFVLCTFAHLVRCILSKQPMLRRKYIHPLLALYFLLAVVCYLRDPALPTFGKGEGSGFSRYVSFFCSFLPFIFLPQMISRKTLSRLPRWIMALSGAAAFVHTLLIVFAEPHVQLVFIGADQLRYAAQGRYSYLSSSAVLFFASSLTVLAFSRRVSVFERPVAVACSIAGLLGIFLTGTRSLVLAAVAAVLCTLATKRWWGAVTACVGILLTLVLVRVTLPATESRILEPVIRSVNFLTTDRAYARSTFDFQNTETMRWRLRLWEGGIRSVRQHPLLGRGFSARYGRGLSPHLLPVSSQKEISVERSLDIGATHNMWLAPFVSFGVPAGICFVLFVVLRGWRLVQLAFRIRPGHELYVTAQFLLIWLSTVVASSVTGGGTVSTGLLLLLALAMIVEYAVARDGAGDEKGTDGDAGEGPALPVLDP